MFKIETGEKTYVLENARPLRDLTQLDLTSPTEGVLAVQMEDSIDLWMITGDFKAGAKPVIDYYTETQQPWRSWMALRPVGGMPRS